MKISQIRDMSDGEIRTTLEDRREEMFNLRLQEKMGTLENYARMKEVKRDLARLLTVLRERALAAALVSAKEEEA